MVKQEDVTASDSASVRSAKPVRTKSEPYRHELKVAKQEPAMRSGSASVRSARPRIKIEPEGSAPEAAGKPQKPGSSKTQTDCTLSKLGNDFKAIIHDAANPVNWTPTASSSATSGQKHLNQQR